MVTDIELKVDGVPGRVWIVLGIEHGELTIGINEMTMIYTKAHWSRGVTPCIVLQYNSRLFSDVNIWI